MLTRVLDLIVSSLLLLIFLPIFLLLVFLIRTKLGGPVIFQQIRPGYHGKPFNLFKFRTMTNAKNQAGTLLSDEERMTPFGHLLRSTSLDELPELWNVFKGEMSLVGPRPLLMEYLPLYSPDQIRRHEVKPGLTGWAQVNGRNALSWDEKFQLDIWYVENKSFWLDLKILFLTVKCVFKRDGVSSPGSITAEKFSGN